MRVFLGILLIIVACAALCVIVVVPVLPPLKDNTTVDTYLAVLLCKPNETLVREQYSFRDFDGRSYSMTPFCINSERQKEDVNLKWVIVGAGSFVIPFLIGLFLVIWGAASIARRQAAKLLKSIPDSHGGTGFTVSSASGSMPQGMDFRDGVLNIGGFQMKLDGLTPEKIQALKAQMQTAAGSGDLTEKLRQLQQARDNGLISSSEYDRLRQKILDDIT